MRANHFAWLTVAYGCLGALGCATEVTGFGGGDEGGADGTGSTSASTSVATTSASTTTGMMGCPQNCADLESPPCKESVCNTQTGMCELMDLPDGSACEDGLFCTIDETCSAGVCEPGGAYECTGMDDCTVSTCSEDANGCVDAPKPNGTSCTSSDPCIANAICQNGACLGAPKDCSATAVQDECHVAVCDPMQGGQCVPVIGNNGQACTTFGDPCMVQKTCDQGQCLGGIPKDCSAFTVGCTNGVCEPSTGVCYGDPIPPGATCLEATDDCNVGTCDMNGTCVGAPTNEGGVCNDGSSCTINDVCTAGTCAGVPDPNYTIYFTETFASNAAGWTLGPNWGIGSATASTGQIYGNPDPANDHTTSADNGVAGVVIGGNAPTASIHPYYYITSPVINTSAVSGSLWLEYWRWLNSDYTSYMQNIVEVYDGNGWVTLWITGGPPGIQDAAWTKQSFDVTAYKNANMRIRWGYQIGSGGVFTVSSWNLDDVSLASAPCN